MVYGREVDGTVTTFGTTGYTYDRVFVLYDRLTRSVWYPLDDEAFVWLSGNNRRAKVSAMRPTTSTVKLQVSAQLVTTLRVTFQTAPSQQRPHVLFEMLELLSRDDLIRLHGTITEKEAYDQCQDELV